MKIIELESVNSTNEYCKKHAADGDFIVIAKRQSAGKGTKGRSFSSDEGGLYISVSRSYEDFNAADAFKIMINTCVAVCKTLENFGITPTIRWANDVLVNGKKICGTLIENTFCGNKITRSIVGCGINVNNELPEDLKPIATTMKECAGRVFDISNVKKQFIRNLKKQYTVEDYKSYINWLGSEVTLKDGLEETRVTAVDILSDGRLKVNKCGNMLEISAGELSLRL